jgi:hypothetical protein
MQRSSEAPSKCLITLLHGSSAAKLYKYKPRRLTARGLL